MFGRKHIILVMFLFIVGGLLAGCSTSSGAAKDNSSEKKEKTEETGEQKSKTNEKSEEEKEENSKKAENVIDVSAFEMEYDPKEITLQKGEEYELVLSNDGEMFHDLTQKEMDMKITFMSEMADHPESLSFFDKMLGVKKVYANGEHDGGHEGNPKNIHMNAKSGQTVRIKFIPQEKGEFEFFCSVPGHKEAGMVGKFIVE